LKITAQHMLTQFPVLSEPKAVPVFIEGDPSLNYLILLLTKAPATQNIKSCTHLIKQKIVKME